MLLRLGQEDHKFNAKGSVQPEVHKKTVSKTEEEEEEERKKSTS